MLLLILGSKVGWSLEAFKRQINKVTKHTQAICLSVFGHFVGLPLKGLINPYHFAFSEGVLKSPISEIFSCVKSVEIRNFFSSVISGIQTEYGDFPYSTEYGKIRTRKNSAFGHFSHSGFHAMSNRVFLISDENLVLFSMEVYKTIN